MSKIEDLIEGEKPETRDALKDILGSRRFTAEQVARVLTDAGKPISASSIRTYRRALEAR